MNATILLAALVFIVIASIGLLAFRRKLLATMAVRNIARRKTHSAIVIAGLMIATAMIAASLVVGDTLDYVIKKDTYDSTGNTDIVVSVPDANGIYTYFNRSISTDLIASSASLPSVDRIAPAIRDRVSLLDLRTSLPYPGAELFAFDPQNAANPLRDEQRQPISVADLGPGNIVMNRALADEINALEGDTVLLITEQGLNVPMTVARISADDGMGDWQNGKLLFLELSNAQKLLNKSGMIDVIDVSCTGGIQDGYLLTHQALAELQAALPTTLSFQYDTIKEDGVVAAQNTADMVSQIFVVMSSFAIIAGVALITNIFVMLAEERKPEMGISRAIGMQRGDLTQSFMFEGAIYAILASAVGAGAGLLIADVMISLFASVFTGFGVSFAFHFEMNSIVTAAFAGFLITMVTVIAASWRVSKLNIVRAIRDIPEPVAMKTGRSFLVLAVLALGMGIMLILQGYVSKEVASVVAGPSLAALGAALIASRFMRSPRIPFTISSLFVLFWVLDPLDIGRVFGNLHGGFEMFIVSGVLLVTGGVIFVITNSDSLLTGLVRTFGRKDSTLPVFKIAVSYPLNKKFRTGLTLFIFALIMFTVIVISMISSFERESVTTMTESYSGGFQIIGFSFRDIDQNNMTQHLTHLNDTFEGGAIQRVEMARTVGVKLLPAGANETTDYDMVGFPHSMLLDNGFSLSDRLPMFDSDQATWAAVNEPNSSLCIMDGNVAQQMFGYTGGPGGPTVRIGQQVTAISATGGQRNFTVVGIMNQMMISGLFTSNDNVVQLASDSRLNMFYFESGLNLQRTEADLAKALEAEFVQYGLVTFAVKDTVEMILGMVSSIMQLFEIFLGVGLIVGITGLGIITIRNVAERRQEIGVMRAIGYQKDMILKTFLLETSFVSLLGIILGVLLGLALSRELYDWGEFSKSAPFVIPWLEILAVVAIAFVVTLASTLPPSRRASKLAPAEALRRLD